MTMSAFSFVVCDEASDALKFKKKGGLIWFRVSDGRQKVEVSSRAKSEGKKGRNGNCVSSQGETEAGENASCQQDPWSCPPLTTQPLTPTPSSSYMSRACPPPWHQTSQPRGLWSKLSPLGKSEFVNSSSQINIKKSKKKLFLHFPFLLTKLSVLWACSFVQFNVVEVRLSFAVCLVSRDPSPRCACC